MKGTLPDVTTEYTVHLEAFHGPLDLLLYLIRKAEVDIHDIPVATLADQYMAHLEHIDKIDIEVAGEFLVMAASLMEIKSRMIAAESEAPNADEDEGDDKPRSRDDAPDPRAELVAQLLEYKRYRDAADELDYRREQWESRYPIRPIGVHGDELKAAFEAMDDIEVEDLNLSDLISAFERIAESVNMERLGEHEVFVDETPIELHAEDILDRLRRETTEGGQMSLFSVLNGRTRAEMVGLFLAMLDLVRQHRLAFRQNQEAAGTLDEIVLELREPEELPDDQMNDQLDQPEGQAGSNGGDTQPSYESYGS